MFNACMVGAHERSSMLEGGGKLCLVMVIAHYKHQVSSTFRATSQIKHAQIMILKLNKGDTTTWSMNFNPL